MEFVRTAAKDDAARFVVGRDDDKGFVGVLLVEFVSHLYGLVHVLHFVEYVCCIVAMACPVDFSAFDHKEEAVLLLRRQRLDGGLGNLCERQVIGFAVEGIGDAFALALAGGFGLEEQHLLALLEFLLIVGIAAGDDVARLAALLVE